MQHNLAFIEQSTECLRLAAVTLGSAALTAWQCFCRLHIAGSGLHPTGSVIHVTHSLLLQPW